MICRVRCVDPRPCHLPRGHLRRLLRPGGTGVTPLIFPNTGGADQLAILAINHSNAVPDGAIHQEQFHRQNGFRSQGWHQPGRGTIRKSQAPHHPAGGVMKAIGLAVISAVVRPTFLDSTAIVVAIPIDLLDVGLGGIGLEITRAAERFDHRSRRRVARPASMPLAEMVTPEGSPIPIRGGDCWIMGSWSGSFTTSVKTRFTQPLRQHCCPGVPISRLESTDKERSSKTSPRTGCLRPKHARADPNGLRLDA